MRRWNGWGEIHIRYPLSPAAGDYLAALIEPGYPSPDASLEQVIAHVPPSRLGEHPGVDRQPEVRLRHARGQSLPDWVALRSGQIDVFPDGVAYPESPGELREMIDFAYHREVALIPYGGGTSVVGHINPLPGDRPVLTVDLSRMNRLVTLDDHSLLATFEAGVRGPDLERQLNAHGFTLGHFPQSFEFSTLGGWIATRSSGQQSYGYGRIKDMLAGCVLDTPSGLLEIPPLPASAAGPDLRHLVLGSDGRLGIIRHATMRIHPLPEVERFYGVFFRNWETGVEALRALAQSGIRLSMARLSDPQETAVTLVQSDRQDLVSGGKRALGWLGFGSETCLLIYAISSARREVDRIQRAARGIWRTYRGLYVGRMIGEQWRRSRFRAPYLRNTLWDLGYAVDTLETATTWAQVIPLAHALRQTINQALAALGERLLVLVHLSHLYRDGANIYVTYIFRRGSSADETLARWSAIKTSASQTILSRGATISHHHGVGLDHVPYMTAEKGAVGVAALEALRASLDPRGLLNPGKLLPAQPLGSSQEDGG